MEGCDVSTKVFILMQNKSLGACRLRFIISKMEDLLHTPDFFCRGIKTFVLTSQTFITSVHRDAGLWCCPELWRCRSMRALSRRARRAVGIYVARQQTSLSLSLSLSLPLLDEELANGRNGAFRQVLARWRGASENGPMNSNATSARNIHRATNRLTLS